MALFKRKTSDEAVSPPVLTEYYDEQRKRRSGLRWLLGLAGLVIIALVATGLYFGGRWAYHRLHHIATKKPATTAPAQTNTTKNTQSGSSNTSGASNKSSNQGQVNAPGSSSTSTPSSSGKSSSTPSSGSSSSNTPAKGGSGGSSNTAAPSSNTPAQSGALTNTGPGDVVATFIAVSALSAGLYELKLHRQKSNY